MGFALEGWHESNFGNKKPSSLNFINGVGSLELSLRHVKTTLGMEMLRGKTPDMVRKEIYVHLMAYNLLRTVMWQAGKKAGVWPVRISLQGTP